MSDDISFCDECGIEADPGDLYLCALSMPWATRQECAECAADCGPCRDEMARDWQDEHGLRGRI